MEATFTGLAGYIALALEVVAVAIIAVGGAQAFWAIVVACATQTAPVGRKKEVWVRFGTWLLMGLEFELAADIVRTVITPSWEELGRLGAIAVIRTFLNFFLERDVEKYAGPTIHRASSGAEPENSQ